MISLVILIILIIFIIYSQTKFEFFGSNNIDTSNCNDNRPWILDKKYPKYNDKDMKNKQIFVSVASYRDSECSNTIRSIFENAKYPHNVFIGICEQNKKGSIEESCIQKNIEPMGLDMYGSVRGSQYGHSSSFDINEQDIVEKYKNNIKVYKMDYMEAKGPTYARFFCSTLWSGQQYYLQIDSHTDFVKDWDDLLISMIEKCRYTNEEPTAEKWGNKGSKKPVLSSYPPADTQMSLSGFPQMNSCKIATNGLPVYYAEFVRTQIETSDDPEKNPKPNKSPKPFVAAGLMFLDASFLYEVPYDPYLSGLFQGEETLFSARLFTNGYDVYAPNIKICSHSYNRKGPMYHDDMPDFTKCKTFAENKVLFMLGLENVNIPKEYLRSFKNYGLGFVRSINEFWKESGIIVEKQKLKSCK